MLTYVNMVAAAFFGRSLVRRAILGTFFNKPGIERHVRELARELGYTPEAVSNELDLLERSGVLVSSRVGRARRYRLNTTSAAGREVRALFQRTIGLEARLRSALEGVPGVEEAFIYGSYARGEDLATSDIDVMVIGDADRTVVSEAVVAVEQEIGREVNITQYSRRDLDRLRSRRDPFVRDVLGGTKVSLVGRKKRS